MPNVINARGKGIAGELASLTGDDWRENPSEDCDWYTELVRMKDGLTISLRVDYHSKRFFFRWSNHAAVYKVSKDPKNHIPDPRGWTDCERDKWPKITCSPDKTNKRLALDIIGRLLPKAEKMHKAALEIVDGCVSREEKQADFIARLQDAGINLSPKSWDPTTYTATGSGWSLEVTTGGADFRGYHLSQDQIISIVRRLNDPEAP
jgi:hypothetical protein